MDNLAFTVEVVPTNGKPRSRIIFHVDGQAFVYKDDPEKPRTIFTVACDEDNNPMQIREFHMVELISTIIDNYVATSNRNNELETEISDLKDKLQQALDTKSPYLTAN